MKELPPLPTDIEQEHAPIFAVPQPRKSKIKQESSVDIQKSAELQPVAPPRKKAPPPIPKKPDNLQSQPSTPKDALLQDLTEFKRNAAETRSSNSVSEDMSRFSNSSVENLKTRDQAGMSPASKRSSGRIASIISEFEKRPEGGAATNSPPKITPNKLTNTQFVEKLQRQLEGSASSQRKSLNPPSVDRSLSANDLKNRPIRSASETSPVPGVLAGKQHSFLDDISVTIRKKMPNAHSAHSLHEAVDGVDAKSVSSEDAALSASQTNIKIPTPLSIIEDRSKSPISQSTSPSSSTIVSPMQKTPSSMSLLKDNLKEFSPFSKKTKKKKVGGGTSSIQKSLQPPPAPKPKWHEGMDEKERETMLAAMTKEERIRQDVSWEILTTEEDYISDLLIVVNMYVKPMYDLKISQKSKEVNELFSNLEQLLPVNKVFLQELRKCRKNYVMDGVGVAFLSVADYFKLYTMYCVNHGNAVVALGKLMKNDQTISKYLKDVYSKPDFNGLNLESYLLKPVQRICKYPLLLRELLKATADDHKDRKSLETAKEKIDAIVAIVNERTKHIEVMLKTLEAVRKIKDGRDLHSPTRKYVHDGPLALRHSQDPENGYKKFHLFLFNDTLVISKPPTLLQRDNKYVIYDRLDLNSAVISDIPDEETMTNCFTVLNVSTEDCYVAVAASFQEKQKWLTELEKCGTEQDAQRGEQVLSKFPLRAVSSSSLPQHERSRTEGSTTDAIDEESSLGSEVDGDEEDEEERTASSVDPQ